MNRFVLAVLVVAVLAIGWAVAADQVTVCHKPAGERPQTLEVPQAAVPTHLNHGDSLGACPTSPNS